MLRPYQQAAVDAALDFWKGSADPILIDAATGAGKSHIIAAVAEKIHGKTGKARAVSCAIRRAGAAKPRKIRRRRVSCQHVQRVGRRKRHAAPCCFWIASDSQEQDQQVSDRRG